MTDLSAPSGQDRRDEKCPAAARWWLDGGSARPARRGAERPRRPGVRRSTGSSPARCRSAWRPCWPGFSSGWVSPGAPHHRFRGCRCLHRPDPAVAQGLRGLDVRHSRQAGADRRDGRRPRRGVRTGSACSSQTAGWSCRRPGRRHGCAGRGRASISRPDASGPDVLPTLLGTAVGIATLFRLRPRPSDDLRTGAWNPLTRRRVIAGGSALVAGFLGDALRRAAGARPAQARGRLR